MTTITVKIGTKDYTVETDAAPGAVLEVWGGWQDRDGLKATRICEHDGVEYFLVEFQTFVAPFDILVCQACGTGFKP